MIALEHRLHGEEMGQVAFWEIVFIKCPLESKVKFPIDFYESWTSHCSHNWDTHYRRALLLRDGVEVVEEIITMFLMTRERQRQLSLPTKSSSLWSGNRFCVQCLPSSWEVGSLHAAGQVTAALCYYIPLVPRHLRNNLFAMGKV